jgi:aryl-alcohol dehydrogenase-like predicted oxidoreductase
MGYGMWGMASWSNSSDDESLGSLQAAVDRGCTFFDTAYAYGDGRSENLLGQIVRSNPGKRIYTATKIPPKDLKWPALPESTLMQSYPPDHVEEYVHRSLENAALEQFDLMQFHTWNDEWMRDDRWFYRIDDMRSQKLINAVGISINRWEPWNGIRAVRSGQIDAVQVIYNIFDQNPEDELFPACRTLDVAVIARVPFDEGSLTGMLTRNTTWPDGDFRNIYFTPENLTETLERVERLQMLVPSGMDLPEMALRFILASPEVSTVIPGMRKARHVERNLSVGDGEQLPGRLLDALRAHRWVRTANIE